MAIRSVCRADNIAAIVDCLRRCRRSRQQTIERRDFEAKLRRRSRDGRCGKNAAQTPKTQQTANRIPHGCRFKRRDRESSDKAAHDQPITVAYTMAARPSRCRRKFSRARCAQLVPTRTVYFSPDSSRLISLSGHRFEVWAARRDLVGWAKHRSDDTAFPLTEPGRREPTAARWGPSAGGTNHPTHHVIPRAFLMASSNA